MTFAICPEKSFKSDADGIVRGSIKKGLLGQFRAEHPDDVSVDQATG